MKWLANSESKDGLVLGKVAKKKRIEVVGNVEESLMKTDLDEFKDLISMPIDFVIPEKFSDMIEKINPKKHGRGHVTLHEHADTLIFKNYRTQHMGNTHEIYNFIYLLYVVYINISFKDNKTCNMTLISINLYNFCFIIVS
ncbi:hypothetical protein CsSME_00006953 [Camellia sinensis var. sinensis]